MIIEASILIPSSNQTSMSKSPEAPDLLACPGPIECHGPSPMKCAAFSAPIRSHEQQYMQLPHELVDVPSICTSWTRFLEFGIEPWFYCSSHATADAASKLNSFPRSNKEDVLRNLQLVEFEPCCAGELWSCGERQSSVALQPLQQPALHKHAAHLSSHF